MAFSITFLPRAERELRALDVATARRILQKLVWISQQENPLQYAKHLHGGDIGDVRFRIGDYCAIGILEGKPKRLLIVTVGHRRDIYRER